MGAPRICPRPGCSHVQPCPLHARQAWAGRSSARDRGYTAEWDRESKAMRERGDLCGRCHAQPAVELDHIIPLARGGSSDPWANGEPLCKACHDKKTGRENRGRPAGAAP